jgi:competence protein ComEC
MSRRAVTIAAAAAASLPVGAAGLWTSGGETSPAPAAPTAPAKIAFVDVGQGDGVVMRIGGTIVVSDAGEFHPERVDRTLRSLGAGRTIDVAIMSHPHDDHVANYVRLVRDFGWRIERAVLSRSAWWSGTDTNAELIGLLRENRTELEFVDRGDRFDWGGARWEILNPPRGEFTGGATQAANVSVAYLLEVHGATVLFTGDVEPKVARRLAADLSSRLTDRVDVFLATHHGSKHGSTPELLAAARPRFAVLSVGDRNAFEHPAAEAVARLRAARATIWCTDTNGTITARISRRGRITWATTSQQKPWWSSATRQRTGTCAGRR